MKKSTLLLLVLYSSLLVYSQGFTNKRFLLEKGCNNKKAELKTSFASGKKILPEFELPILVALSAFSELKDTKITFKKKRINTSMACRPRLSFIIKKRIKRSYVVLINYESTELKGLMLSDIPFNSQVGIIAHEIAHALDYSSKTNAQIIKEGFAYIKKENRYKLEKHIDSLTIFYGFGWQLHDWAKFVLDSDIHTDYKEYKRKTYLLPEEIIGIIETN